MRRVISTFQVEIAYIVRKSLQWTIVAALFALGVWFMTFGVPRLASAISGS